VLNGTWQFNCCVWSNGIRGELLCSCQPNFGQFTICIFKSSPYVILLGHAPIGTQMVALDPTFVSFILLESISH